METIEKSIRYLKSLAAETVSNAGTGHTGSAVGATSILFALFKDHLKFLPDSPGFINRDRFILSAGHVSALYYSLLHMFGYNVTIDDLKAFRKYGSKTPGHPEVGVVPGVESSTGPLGQGVANAVGMAIAESMLEARFNKQDHEIINNYTYCYCGDGCLMEGVAVEACSVAGALNLNKLILLYDDNNITIDGKRTIANTENTAKKFSAMGWDVIEVKEGHDFFACSKAIREAKLNEKPTIIIFNTTIGIGTSKEGTEKVHAYPLPAEELAEFKTKLQVEGSFYVPEDVYECCKQTIQTNKTYEHAWKIIFESYKTNYADDCAKLLEYVYDNKKANYSKILNDILKLPEMAGRDLSKVVLNELSKVYTNLVGGSADLIASTKAHITDGESYSAKNRTGRNIHFGIREHSMGAIVNGITLYAGTPAFDSTFLAFSNYMLPALRMRAMMNLPAFTIFTHDSIDVGPDGPTHQPIDQIGQLRQLIGYKVFRPANAAEVVAAYKHFFETKSPMAMIFSKSKLLNAEGMSIAGAEKGGYVLLDTKKNPKIEIFATGKDVELALSVAKELESLGVRVISMPCESLFASQSAAYKSKVLLEKPVLKVAIEASNDPMWYKYIGENGLLISVSAYHPSGKSSEVYEKAGFNTKDIIKQIKKKLK